MPPKKSGAPSTTQPTKTPAKRGGKSASLELNCTAKADEIATAVSSSFYWWDYPPVKTDEECAERLNEFFRHCIETKELPTVEKMGLALGVARTTVHDWEVGRVGPVRAHMIKKAKAILASIDADLVANGLMNTVAYIFRAKNFYGMKDQAEVTVTHTSETPDKTPAELAEKYIGSTVIDVDFTAVDEEGQQGPTE